MLLDICFQNQTDKETSTQLDLNPKTTYLFMSSSCLSQYVAGYSALFFVYMMDVLAGGEVADVEKCAFSG